MAGDPKARAFLTSSLQDPSARKGAVERAAARTITADVAELVARQNAPLSAAGEKCLAALRQPGTAVVFTGQQVGLFLGPLYTVYKAATAIKVAAALEAETGRRCVPLFWLQTEDHDFAEINVATVARPDGTTRQLLVAGHGVPPDSRVPVKHLTFGPGIQGVLQQVAELLGEQPHISDVMTLLNSACRPDASWPGAFAALLRGLFGNHGLLVVDPRTPEMAALAAPIHRRALQEAPAISAALLQRAQAMHAAGFEPQVHVRDGAPLSFFSPDAVDGPRYRLEPKDAAAWTLVGHPAQRTVTTAQLLDALDTQPARFSTSALLRPILQDTLFPTAAYVGGPAEMTYFAQLEPLYRHFGMTMPLAIPRARFRVLDPRTRANLEALSMTADEACGPRESALQALAQRNAVPGLETPQAVQARLLGAVTGSLDALEGPWTAVDATLAKHLRMTRTTLTRSVGQLTARYARALAQRDDVTTARLDRVRQWLTPEAQPQERVHSVLFAASRFGAQAFVDLVVEQTRPFDGGLRDLTP